MWQQEDDNREELKLDAEGDLPSLFSEAPVMRSIPQYNDLNAPTGRAFGGVDMMFGGPADDLAMPSFWGAAEEERDYMPHHPSKELEADLGKLKLGGGVSDLWSRTEVLPVGEPTVKHTASVPLEDVPFYVERHTSFVTRSTSPVLIAALSEIFDKINVDAEPFSHQHRMKGFAYDASRADKCSFRVQVYQGEQEGERVCEFQRRAGCVVSFHNFYAKSLEMLGAHVLRAFAEASTSRSAGINAPSGLGMPSLRAGADLSLAPPTLAKSTCGLDTNTMQALLAMASSRNADVQREGLTALAAVSCDAGNQEALIAAHVAGNDVDLIATLEGVLGSPDEHVRRTAALLLTNLCQQETLRGDFASKLLTTLLEELDTPAALDNRETKRNVASALAALSSTHSSAFPSDLEALKRYAHCQDAVLRAHINTTLNNHSAGTQLRV